MTTLEELRAEHQRLAEKIAALEAQAEPRYITIPRQVLALDAGDYYAGVITYDYDKPSYHLILLGGEAESVTFDEARKWACEAGGGLPTRREQALLYANLQDQFERAWYWSDERLALHSDQAWMQNFGLGTQGAYHKGNKPLARAVRRVFI